MNDLNLTVDKEASVRAAKAHGSGDSDLFSTALGFLGQHKVRMIIMIVSIDIVFMFFNSKSILSLLMRMKLSERTRMFMKTTIKTKVV